MWECAESFEGANAEAEALEKPHSLYEGLRAVPGLLPVFHGEAWFGGTTTRPARVMNYQAHGLGRGKEVLKLLQIWDRKWYHISKAVVRQSPECVVHTQPSSSPYALPVAGPALVQIVSAEGRV